MPFFSKVFKGGKDGSKKKEKENGVDHFAPPQPRWDDAWQRETVEPEEIQELLRGLTSELKSRGMTAERIVLIGKYIISNWNKP